MKRSDFELKLQKLDGTGEFTGIASVYGNRDSSGEVVRPGAFTKTISERGAEIPILYQHDAPIGKGQVEDSESGLLVRGTIIRSVEKGEEAYQLAMAGVVKGLSIGYAVIKDAWNAHLKVRELLELKLYEISLVTFPANEMARLTGVKQADVANIAAAMEEIKAGRTLSAATRKRIETAITDLQALLAEADAEPQAAPKGIKPEEFHSMLNAWRSART